ncbi:hypothetical protein [Ferruginibacter profundus]
MIPRVALLILSLLITKVTFSQLNDCDDKPVTQSFFGEFLGNSGALLSINYERIFGSNPKNKIHYSIRAGFASSVRHADSTRIYNIPLEFNIYYGKKRHFMESSLGWTGIIGKDFTDMTFTPAKYYQAFENLYTFRIGYRLITQGGGFIRVAPLVLQLTNYGQTKLRYTIAIAAGYCW